MTPLYDVLTSQPGFDAREIEGKAFRLPLAVGRSRHYRLEEILPRHFTETADLAGVGMPVMRAIVEDLADCATRVVDEVAAALSPGFSEPLVESIKVAVARRSRLCVEASLR